MGDVHIEEFRVTVDSKQHIAARWGDFSVSARDPLEIDPLRLKTVRLLIRLLRRNRMQSLNDMRVLGEHLFLTLFGVENSREWNAVGNLLTQAMEGSAEPAGEGRLLCVSLNIEPTPMGLAAWPWEYLHIPVDEDGNSGFLTERAQLVRTRTAGGREQMSIHVAPPARVLFVALGPKDMPVDYESVLEQLTELRDTKLIELTVLANGLEPTGAETTPYDQAAAPRATLDAFLSMVNHVDPHVIHIIGHGRYRSADPDSSDTDALGGQLAFCQSDHSPKWVSDQALANLLPQGGSLRLIFMQTCDSARSGQAMPYEVISGMASHLAGKKIPAVVAMQFQVENRLANEFARVFYTTLGKLKPVESAMYEARRKLYVDAVGDSGQSRGFGLPVLYLQGSGPLLVPLEPGPAEAGAGAGAGAGIGVGAAGRRVSAVPAAELDCVWCGEPTSARKPYCRFCSHSVRCHKCEERVKSSRAQYCEACRTALVRPPPGWKPQGAEVRLVEREHPQPRAVGSALGTV